MHFKENQCPHAIKVLKHLVYAVKKSKGKPWSRNYMSRYLMPSKAIFGQCLKTIPKLNAQHLLLKVIPPNEALDFSAVSIGLFKSSSFQSESFDFEKYNLFFLVQSLLIRILIRILSLFVFTVKSFEQYFRNRFFILFFLNFK